MLGGVFICYRREDSAGFARLIYNRLTHKLGDESVFFDVDDIAPGLDFVDILSDRVGKCDALIAVIGKSWASSVDLHNRRRLDDPNDFVRIEIQAALERKIRVIPVLVDGARMPEPDDLPDNLKKLTRRQGIEISHTRFDSDVERLTRALSLLDEELRKREADEAERSLHEERERHEAAGAEERAEQARQAAEREAAHRAEEERHASEPAEAERAAAGSRQQEEAPRLPTTSSPNDCDGALTSRKGVAGRVLAAVGVIVLIALAAVFIPPSQSWLRSVNDKGRPPLVEPTIAPAAPANPAKEAAPPSRHVEIDVAPPATVDAGSSASNAAATANRASNAAKSGPDPTPKSSADSLAKDPIGFSAQVNQTIANMLSDDDAVRRPARIQLGQLVSADDSLAPPLIRDMISDAYPPASRYRYQIGVAVALATAPNGWKADAASKNVLLKVKQSNTDSTLNTHLLEALKKAKGPDQ